MRRKQKAWISLLAGLVPCSSAFAGVEPTADHEPLKQASSGIVVIPIRAQIAKPELYILRRGLKEAIDKNADTVVLDMDTPGGALNVTFEMLQALEKFPGKTVTYINSEAISAGALISAGTDEIYFAPGAVIGAAAPVMATGGEIDATMKAKINSYLKARVRSISEGKGFRGEVLSAMIDADHELKIGDTVIKPKGELLSLTAQEAMKPYGDPPQSLLGAGIYDSLDELLTALRGAGEPTVTRLEISWSEKVAQYITAITPVLLGLGLLGLFIEFKTPGFGIFGASGLILLGLVFFGHHAAGLSGHEPALFFLLGVLLVAVELFLFPGTFAFAVTGLGLMLASLVWSMLDLWPDKPIALDRGILIGPVATVLSGLVMAVVAFLVILRILPRGGPWNRLVLEAAIGGVQDTPRSLYGVGTQKPATHDLVGQAGVAVTALFPSGQIEVGGKRYEAKLESGYAEPGTPVRITRISEFALVVEVLT